MDAIFALRMIAPQVDRQLGTHYAERIKAHHRYAQENDLALAGAVTDSNPLHCNVGKYLFAENFHVMIKNVQEVTGGSGGTCPCMQDYNSPELHDKLERYLCGRSGVSTEAHLRVIKRVRDLTASCDAGGHMFGSIPGEGTLEAQRMMVLRDFDMQPAIELA